MQAEPKSDNLGGLIALLGLVVLVAGLVVMLLLPEIEAAAWGILAVGVALLAIAFVINFRRVRSAVAGRRGRFGLGTGIMASVFIGITILVNAISIGQYHRFDTSSLSQFTLTPQTVDVLEELDTPVKAIGFMVPDDYYGIADYVTGLLTEYEVNSRQLTVQYIDPDEHPDQANKYGITMYQTVVFESGDRYRLVEPSQFLTYDSSGNLVVQAEYNFTSAILEVTGVAQKKVYFLTGHGEASIDAGFSRAGEGLRDDLYLVDTLNLMTDPSVPDDCAVLIIAAPQSNLTDEEVSIITDYLQSGGQAMILTNPDSPTSIDEIVSPWGISIGEGTVIDPSSSVSPYQDMPLVPEDRDYFLLPSVYFPGATAIVLQESVPADIGMMPLAWTTSSSWLDKNFSVDEEAVFDSETEKMEQLAIGMLIAGVPTTGSATDDYTRLVVIGDSDFASDEHFDSANNSDLFLNSVSWLAEETSLISIRRNVQPFRRLVVTEGQQGFIEYSSITLFPILVLAAGGVIWWRRR
jgi:ABC-type uncharacterized transport system involved in gliding motility auxiliary subunit